MAKGFFDVWRRQFGRGPAERERVSRPYIVAEWRNAVLAVAILTILLCVPAGDGDVRAGSRDLMVVASIKPVHSLVAGVMKGIGTPHLIVRGGGTPHGHALRPSDARALQGASAIFWIGPHLETFLKSPIGTLPRGAANVPLGRSAGLTLYKIREGGPWAGHGEGHEAGHTHEKDGASHLTDETDLHIWLDPINAGALVHRIVATLAQADPDRAEAYRKNGRVLTARLEALVADMRGQLDALKRRPFLVFHDGYQYLEKRFGLRAVGSIAVDPERQPGARRLKRIRARIETLGPVCVFAEPQFRPKLVHALIKGTGARVGVLDPMGADLADGPDLYFELMRRNARALAKCLTGSG